MSRRVNLAIPDGLYEQIEALVEAQPRAVRVREKVTMTAVIREALIRGVASLEREVKQGVQE